MGHTKLFNDVTDTRVLDKLIPIDSPHHIQMSQLMIDVISLVPDDESNHSARKNRRVGGYLYADNLLSGVWCDKR